MNRVCFVGYSWLICGSKTKWAFFEEVTVNKASQVAKQVKTLRRGVHPPPCPCVEVSFCFCSWEVFSVWWRIFKSLKTTELCAKTYYVTAKKPLCKIFCCSIQVDPDACHLRGGPLGAKTQADRIISGPKICPLVQDNQPWFNSKCESEINRGSRLSCIFFSCFLAFVEK